MKKSEIVFRIMTISGVLLATGAILCLGLLEHGRTVRKEEEMERIAELPVKMESCLIDEESGETVIKAWADEIPESDDEYFYLFALRPYEDEIEDDKAHLMRMRKGNEIEFCLKTGVFDKFVVGVKGGGSYREVSAPRYITNPGAMAVFTSNGEKPSGKKGLLIDPDKLMSEELDELGIKHAAYNIPVSRILGHPEEDEYSAIHYTYNGNEYVFNGRVMAEYDLIFRTLTEKGIEITAIILNDVSLDYPWLIHPLAREGIGKPPYYAFNGSDETGVEYLAAIGTFLTERYSGRMNGRGVVANWVIGNEINARKEWNYMKHVDLELYVREYVRAFRIFYNGVKSVNKACGVYISLDNQWNRINVLTQSYRGKDVLDEFNRQIKAEGNIDWGLAIHPYNKPLTRVDTWGSSIYVKDRVDTPVVSMANIRVVTEYMEQEDFLTEDGEVRSIIISELGYTSSKGEEEQAQAIVYAYRMAEGNPHIDSIIFSRQTDAKEEVERLRLYQGLNRADGSHKYAYEVFRDMDGIADNFPR